EVRPDREGEYEAPVHGHACPEDESPNDRKATTGPAEPLFPRQPRVRGRQKEDSGNVEDEGDPDEETGAQRTDRSDYIEDDRDDPEEVRRQEEGGCRRESRGRIAEPPKRAFSIRQPFVHVLGPRNPGTPSKGFLRLDCIIPFSSPRMRPSAVTVSPGGSRTFEICLFTGEIGNQFPP